MRIEAYGKLDLTGDGTRARLSFEGTRLVLSSPTPWRFVSLAGTLPWIEGLGMDVVARLPLGFGLAFNGAPQTNWLGRRLGVGSARVIRL